MINKALQAGRRLTNVLSIFSDINTNPSVQRLIDHLIPKVQAGLNLAEIVRRVKESIGTTTTTTTAAIDVTPFTGSDGTDLRTDGLPQTAPWQLQWLFANKLDRKDAVTMTAVIDEIAKQLINSGSGGGGSGGGASAGALSALTSSVTKIEESLRTVQSSVSTNSATLNTHSTNFRHFTEKLQQDANALMNLTAQFNHILPNLQSIGPQLPDVKKTVWEAINDIRGYLGKTPGVDSFASGDQATGKTVAMKLNEMDRFITNLNAFYNNLVTSVKHLEVSLAPQKVLDVIGRSYVQDFNLNTSASIAARLSGLERATHSHVEGPDEDASSAGNTSGTAPSRKYWFKEVLMTTAPTSLSWQKADTSGSLTYPNWDDTQRNYINNLFAYPPYEATEHSYVPGSFATVWDTGTIKLFRGKCYIIVMLKFLKYGANRSQLDYELAVTDADMHTKDETVIAKTSGNIARNEATQSSGQTYKLHVFQFRNSKSVDSAMIRFNWKDCYPAQNSIKLESELMYLAPIYYSSSGKPYMNPTPSVSQELSHPLFPATELTYFAIMSQVRDFLLRFMRFRASTVELNPIYMKEVTRNSFMNSTSTRTLESVTASAWTNDTILQVGSQKIFMQRLQGVFLYSWFGEGLRSQGVDASPSLGAHNRVVRFFNHSAQAGKGLFLFAAKIPNFMAYGIETHKFFFDINALSLFGEQHLTVEVLGALYSDTDVGRAFHQGNDEQAPPPFDTSKDEDEPFKPGVGLLNSLNLDKDFAFTSLSRTEIALPQIAPDDIQYTDPVTRINLSSSTVNAIMTGRYSALSQESSFDLGTFPDCKPYRHVWIFVYPKFHSTTFDFAARINFRFKFGDGAGVMGEGVFPLSGIPDLYANVEHYGI